MRSVQALSARCAAYGKVNLLSAVAFRWWGRRIYQLLERWTVAEAVQLFSVSDDAMLETEVAVIQAAVTALLDQATRFDAALKQHEWTRPELYNLLAA